MFRLRAAAAVLVPCLIVAGCSSSGSKGGSGAASSGPATAASPSASSAEAIALADKMRAGLVGLTSAHIEVDAGMLGGKSSGDVSYASGQATASDIMLNSGSDKTEIITVGSNTYAKLPPGRNTSGKPWVVVSASSKNEFVRGLAGSVTISKAAASLPAIADITATATSVQDKGVAAQGHHYALVVQPARSSGTTLGSLLADIGQQSVQVQLYLDTLNRPTHIVIAVALGAQTLGVTIGVSKFDAPLKITAPPAGQVGS